LAGQIDLFLPLDLAGFHDPSSCISLYLQRHLHGRSQPSSFGLYNMFYRSSACGCVICRRDDHKPLILKSRACLSISPSLHCVYTSSTMPPKVTTEVEDDEPTVTGTTSTSTPGTGPGTLRQRFKLTVDDISKEVEELSVKLKRKVRYSYFDC